MPKKTILICGNCGHQEDLKEAQKRRASRGRFEILPFGGGSAHLVEDLCEDCYEAVRSALAERKTPAKQETSAAILIACADAAADYFEELDRAFRDKESWAKAEALKLWDRTGSMPENLAKYCREEAFQQRLRRERVAAAKRAKGEES